MRYLILLIPAILFAIHFYYAGQLNALKGSGRLPDIMGAKAKSELCLALGIVAIVVIGLTFI
ncbi:hypothetical protein [Mucilaginibacter sp. SP1R1]|uniref:hypothetical protein n=1 Tax=Mucilaginibacter sp. SP1R1 TaxID=2723091 RepID=UPI001607676E|nr:hypothetical protein [Mucilaginibacter sp. SP1R1]MBB6149479.1 hypothetical protein [Mucilaginibacter sp. SP1R1]